MRSPHGGGLELHVVGGDQRDVMGIGEADQTRLRRRLRHEAVTLKLNVKSVAEHPPHLGQRRVALRGASGGEQRITGTVGPAGQRDQTLGMSLHHRPRNVRRLGGINVEKGRRGQFAQVAIAGLVLSQQNDGRDPRPAFGAHAADAGHRQGAADDGLDAGLLGQDRKLQSAKQVGAVGQTHRRHAGLGRDLADGVDLDRALQERIGRLHPQMDETFSLQRPEPLHPERGLPARTLRPSQERAGSPRSDASRARDSHRELRRLTYHPDKPRHRRKRQRLSRQTHHDPHLPRLRSDNVRVLFQCQGGRSRLSSDRLPFELWGFDRRG